MDAEKSPPSAQGRLLRALFAPVDIAFLVFFRVVFGCVMLWEVCRYLTHDWIGRYYMDPVFYFSYYGYEWLKPWGGNGMETHFIALGICAALIIAGLCYRLAATLFFLGFTYVFLLDETQYLNQFYLVCLIAFILMLVPAHRAFSLDSWFWPGIRQTHVPALTLWLVRAQIGIPYFYGGIAKLNADWLHGEPMRGWLAVRTDFPLIGRFFTEEWMVRGFTFGGLLFDLLIVPLLLIRRTRVFAFVGAVAFHLMNARLFDIGIFPWFMLAATLVFFPPDFPRRIWRRTVGVFPRASQARTGRSPVLRQFTRPSAGRQMATAAALALYLGFQVLVPLRHWLYPGDVHWTEEGHRFSWRMKLRTKDGEAKFIVTDPATKQTWTIDSESILTRRQAQKMSTRPDMILQFAHHLAESERLVHHRDVEVRAEVTASLNGREPQALIDPEVNLAGKPRSLRHAAWILPLTEPLPKRATRGHSPSDTLTLRRE